MHGSYNCSIFPKVPHIFLEIRVSTLLTSKGCHVTMVTKKTAEVSDLHDYPICLTFTNRKLLVKQNLISFFYMQADAQIMWLSTLFHYHLFRCKTGQRKIRYRTCRFWYCKPHNFHKCFIFANSGQIANFNNVKTSTFNTFSIMFL
jgi:hypothetical protein